jgi:tRNA(Ile)-lysidine synthase
MKQKISDYISKHSLLSRDALHLVALSGGADSVALLRILRVLDYKIEAAHCNFHLRGAESDRDEAFVRQLCDYLGIKLHLIHFDTETYASVHQVSIEMAARELRYGYFRSLCKDIGAETVCVAHHRDDAVETFLMNLLRGSGIHGLTGIRPKNGQIVRPLLCVGRQDILDYLHSIGQDYLTDSTNLESIVLRNKLRLQVLPLLKQLNPKAVENIDKTANYLREAEKVYNAYFAADPDRGQVPVRNNPAQMADRYLSPVRIPLDEILKQPSAECFLHEWLAPYGFNPSQIAQILDALTGESGREFLSATHTLLIDRSQLVLEPKQAEIKPLRIPEAGNYRFSPEILFSVKLTDDISISKSEECATLDAANIQFPLTVRQVASGDAFCPFGMEGRKLVSDFLTDRKISLLEKRRQLVITAANGDIIWLVGQRTDHRYRITASTRQVLSITLTHNS